MADGDRLCLAAALVRAVSDGCWHEHDHDWARAHMQQVWRDSLQLDAGAARAVEHLPADADVTPIHNALRLLRPRCVLEESLAALVLLAVGTNCYGARLRAGLRRLCSCLDVRWSVVGGAEVMLAAALERRPQAMAQKPAAAARTVSTYDRWRRFGAIGAATIVGGGLVALTGGLAAPALAGSVTAAGGIIGGAMGGRHVVRTRDRGRCAAP